MLLKKLVKTISQDISLRKKLMLYFCVILYIFILLTGFLIYNRAVTTISDINKQSTLEQLKNLDEKIQSRLQDYNSIAQTMLLDKNFQKKLEERPNNFIDAYEYDKEIVNYINSLNSRNTVNADWDIYFKGQKTSSHYKNIKSVYDINSEKWFYKLKNKKMNKIIWELLPSDKDNISCEFACYTGIKNQSTSSIPAYFHMTIGVNCISDLMRSTAEQIDGTIFLLNSDNIIMWCNQPDHSALDEYIYNYLNGQETNDDFLITPSDTNIFDYQLICLRSTQTSALRYISFSRYFLAVTIIIMVVSFLMLLISSKLVGRRVTDLAKNIRMVDENTLEFDGNLDGKDEAGELSRAFSDLLERIRALIEHDRILESERFELEIKALHSQINPHFLFNTLSIINLLAQEIEADNISESIGALANFYRLSLSNGKNLITVRDEIEIIDNYLKICSICYRGRLCVARNIDPNTLDCVIPKLIIQPFIENSMFHGFSPYATREPTITITIQLEQDNLIIMLEDNGEGMTEEELQKALSGGFAISNVLRRIELIYGENGSLLIDSKPGRGTAVTIKLSTKIL